MKYIKVYEGWIRQSENRSIVCPYCLTEQYHFAWEICPKYSTIHTCEECNKDFKVKRVDTYFSSKLEEE